MLDRLKTTVTQLRELWRSLSTAKRMALLFVMGSVLLGVLGLALFGPQERYVVLYNELSPQDAASMVEKLDQAKTPYRLEGNGSVILVPQDKVHHLRLELAKAGLPRGAGVGFELFDKSQLGATEFEQRVSLRRALEGELARSIQTVDGVQQARVHLVIPERRLFASQDEKASASVVLKLRNPGAFGKREVAAVVHLVAAAVPGLGRDAVSVVSTEGLTLHRPVSDTAAPLEGADLAAEQARAIGLGLEQEVREQLERVVGPGNADVRVAVTLNPATRERVEEHYDPAKTALRSEHVVQESAGGAEPSVAGVPGARTNLPDANPEGTAPSEEALAEGGGGARRTHTRNWEVDRVTEKTKLPAGDVARLSVAVLLNGHYEARGGSQVYVPRSKEELAALEEIAKRAVGYDEKRGDSFKLETLEFARIDAGPPTSVHVPLWQRYLPHVGAGLGALFLLSIFVLIRRKKKTASARALSAGGAEAVALSGHDGAPAEIEGDRLHDLSALPPANSLQIKEKALEIAARDPATAAVVVRKWLSGTASAQPARS